VDQQNPALSFLSPKAASRLTNASLVVTGKASDDTQPAAVFYQINGSDWTQASGTSNWSANVSLVAGSNIFRAYAVDLLGNRSATNSLGFTFVVNSPLTLITNGLGRITANFKTNWLEIGKPYTVTAIPGPGQVFSNWVGDVSAQTAGLNFVMRSNLTLQANFIPNPFLQATGTYNGLFYNTNRVQDQSGFFTLTLSGGGGYSARLQIGTGSYSVSGQLSLLGTANVNVARRGATPLALTIAVDLDGGQSLTGTVSDGTWEADVVAERATFNSQGNPATQYAARYNLMVPGGDIGDPSFPAGDGYGNVSVDLSGKIALSGALGEGSSLSQTIQLSGKGNWAVYVPLYSGKGSLLGWLNYDTNQPPGGFNGWLSWIRPAQKTALYPNGFTNTILCGASRYTPPVTLTNQVIPLTNGVLTLDGGIRPWTLTNDIVLSSEI
jgi:hypothetical protein